MGGNSRKVLIKLFPLLGDNKFIAFVDEDGEGLIQGGDHKQFRVPTDLNEGFGLRCVGNELLEDEGLAADCIHQQSVGLYENHHKNYNLEKAEIPIIFMEFHRSVIEGRQEDWTFINFLKIAIKKLQKIFGIRRKL